jgi:hypothetical protein
MYLTTVWFSIRKIELRKQFDIVAIVKTLDLQVKLLHSIRVARLLCKKDKRNRRFEPFGFLTRDSYQRA